MLMKQKKCRIYNLNSVFNKKLIVSTLTTLTLQTNH